MEEDTDVLVHFVVITWVQVTANGLTMYGNPREVAGKDM